MAQYAVLIYDDEPAIWSDEQRKEVMDAYYAYSDMLTGKGNGGGRPCTRRAPLPPSACGTGVRREQGGSGGLLPDHRRRHRRGAARCPGAKTGAVELRPVVDFSAASGS